MSAVSQNLCLSWLDFCDSLAQGNKELWRSKICVFLGRIFGVSLAQSDKESWHSRNLCLSASRNTQILCCGLAFLLGS